MNKYLLFAIALTFAFPAYADVDEFVNAVRDGNVARIESYLSSGENINAKNALGNTALHYAVASGDSDMVKFLLENGADANIANSKGWTPAAIAEKKNLSDIVNIFQSDQDNKALSALVTQATETAKVAETKVDSVQNKIIQAAEKTADKAAEIKTKTEAKASELKETAANVAETTKEVTLGAQKKVAQKTEQAIAKTEEKSSAIKDNVAKAKENLATSTEQKVEEAENKVAEIKENIMAPVVQKTEEVTKNAKTTAEKSLAAENKPAVQEKTIKTETKPVEQKVAQTSAITTAATKSAPKRVVKPVAAKPAPKFLASSINKAIYAGDEEIVYCLYFLGLQTDQHNLTLASEFFAGSTTMNKARFEQISNLAHNYYDNASAAELSNMANTCAKIITPQNRDKQNQIIRAMNKAIGY